MLRHRFGLIFIFLVFCSSVSAEQRESTPCVTNLQQEAKKLLNPPDYIDLKDTWILKVGDIDLDGKQDEIFAFNRMCGAHNCHWILFVSNKDCPKFISEFDGSQVSALDTVHHGYKDIRTFWHMGGCGGYESIYEFDGTKYKLLKTAEIGNCS